MAGKPESSAGWLKPQCLECPCFEVSGCEECPEWSGDSCRVGGRRAQGPPNICDPWDCVLARLEHRALTAEAQLAQARQDLIETKVALECEKAGTRQLLQLLRFALDRLADWWCPDEPYAPTPPPCGGTGNKEDRAACRVCIEAALIKELDDDPDNDDHADTLAAALTGDARDAQEPTPVLEPLVEGRVRKGGRNDPPTTPRPSPPPPIPPAREPERVAKRGLQIFVIETACPKCGAEATIYVKASGEAVRMSRRTLIDELRHWNPEALEPSPIRIAGIQGNDDHAVVTAAADREEDEPDG